MKNLYLMPGILLCTILLSTMAPVEAGEQDQPSPTIDERLIRVEERLLSLEKRLDDFRLEVDRRFLEVDRRFDEIDRRFSDVDRRFDELRDDIRNLRDETRSFLLWGFGVTFAGIFALIGFVLWDRRTAISPVIRETKKLSEQEEKLLAAVREYAKEDARLMEILKNLGLW